MRMEKLVRHAMPVLALLAYGISCGTMDAAQQTTLSQAQQVASNRETDSASVGMPRPTTAVARPAAASAPRTAEGVNPVRSIQTTVQVEAAGQLLRAGLNPSYHITQADVLSSAGTFGDFTRYLQVMPGVAWNTDISNDVIVRGGHPSENLYVVDGFEVPNINHIALEGTTGGFTSMIDTSTIDDIDMKAGAYDSEYSSRLSSLIEIHTLNPAVETRSTEFDLGIAGAGGLFERSANAGSSVLLSAHRSVLNLFTNNIGLNGVPIYTNGLARANWSPTAKDSILLLSVNGADSIAIDPCSGDFDETLFDDTDYGGIRSTTGIQWQHVHSPSTVSTVLASYSLQSQTISQQMQSMGSAALNANGAGNCTPLSLTSVYSEHSRDGISNLGYRLQHGRGEWLLSAGSSIRFFQEAYDVVQPVGQQSPFNADPTWTDADNLNRRLTVAQSGTYLEAAAHFGSRWMAEGGARFETFSLTGSTAFNGHVSAAFRLKKRQFVNASFSRSAQLPPTINILSYPQNQRLLPLTVHQSSAGIGLWRAAWFDATIEIYEKCYANEPVSTEYPTLMLANMVDTLGQQFVWLPLRSGGWGEGDGVNLLVHAHWSNRIGFLGAGSYGRVRYAAADGVLRPGNFDIPFTMNGLATWHPSKFSIFSLRDTYASGRPYTPFNLAISEAQQRGIYDLTEINAARGPAYNRADVDFAYIIRLSKGSVNAHAGIDNLFDRENFLGYAWEDRMPMGVPAEKAVYQMPFFPNFGASYRF